MQTLALIFRRKALLTAIFAGSFALTSFSQSVGVGTKTPNPNAILDITAPNNDQGMLMPRLTTVDRTALATKINAGATPSASNSLLVYDTNVQQYFYWSTNTWSNLTGGTNAYVYIGYALDAAGTGYSTSPGPTLDYIGFLSTSTPVTPTGASFTGLWKLYRGPQGVTGVAGANGSNGVNGNSVLSGSVNPAGGTGNNGDFYINTVTNQIFGPKAAGSWPAGISLIGPPGSYTAGAGISISAGAIINTGDLDAVDDKIGTITLAGSTLTVPEGAVNHTVDVSTLINTAGTGISIAGTTINNTGDLDPVDDKIGTVTLAGSTLTIPEGAVNHTVDVTNLINTAGTGINITGTVVTNTGDLDPADDKLTAMSLSGANVLTATEGSNSRTVDLSALSISAMAISNANVLTVTQGTPKTVDLSQLSISSLSLSGKILTVNEGSAKTVDLTSIAALPSTVTANYLPRLNNTADTWINSQFFQDYSTNKVGLGTITPLSALDIKGNLTVGSAFAGISVAPTDGLLVQGNTGIGTNITNHKLDVKGTVAIGSNFVTTAVANPNGLIVEGRLGVGTSNPGLGYNLDVAGPIRTGWGGVWGQVDLYNGTNKFSINLPPAFAQDVSVYLPLNNGSNGQVLTNDGVGNLSWTTPGPLTAGNGLSINTTTVGLGGDLSQNTLVKENSYNLAFRKAGVGGIAALRLENDATAAIDNGSRISFNAMNNAATLIETGSVGGVMLDPSINSGGLAFSVTNLNVPFEAMRLLNSGRLGIGVRSPTSRLHIGEDVNDVTGVTGTFEDISNTTSTVGVTTGIRFSTHTNAGVNFYKGGMFFRRTGASGIGDLIFSTTNTDLSNTPVDATNNYSKMVLKADGSLGVGTDVPGAKMELNGSSGTYLRITTTPSVVTDGAGIELKSTGGTDYVIHDVAGILQIRDGVVGGVTNPTYNISSAFIQPAVDGGPDLGAPAKRWNNIYSMNAPIVTSDQRLKKNIQNINYGLPEVLQLRPVSYQWKKFGDQKTHLGLIAQELETVIPEVVNVGEDADKPLAVSYTELIPVLINAIQEQQKIIDGQKEDNVSLKTRLAQLESQNTAMLKDLDQIKRIVGMEAKSKQK